MQPVGTIQQVTYKNANMAPTNISYISQRREPSRKSVLETLSSTDVVRNPKSYNNSFAQMLAVFIEEPQILKKISEVHNCYPDWSKHIKAKVKKELTGKSKWGYQRKAGQPVNSIS